MSGIDVLRQGWNRLRAFFHKEPLDRDLDAEMASHLEMAIEENMRSGMTPEEARRQALVGFGGVQQAREQQRAARGLPFLDVLGQDVRYTLRTLAAGSWICDRGGADSGVGYWGECRGVQRGEHDSAAAAAVCGFAATGVDCTAAAEVRVVVRDVFGRCV